MCVYLYIYICSLVVQKKNNNSGAIYVFMCVYIYIYMIISFEGFYLLLIYMNNNGQFGLHTSKSYEVKRKPTHFNLAKTSTLIKSTSQQW